MHRLASLATLALVAAPLAAQGDVLGEQKISDTLGSFTGTLADAANFGAAIASLGDLDGDTFEDVAVGAPYDGDGGAQRGSVWILFLNSGGTVKSHQRISSTAGGFGGSIEDFDRFGSSIAFLGDVDGDSVGDIAVGSPANDAAGDDAGCVWILNLNANGTVKSERRITAGESGFAGPLADLDAFGTSVAALGDVDGDTIPDLAVGAPNDDNGGANAGAAWVLLLKADGSAKSHRKLSPGTGGFVGPLASGDLFGDAVGGLGDVDGDTIPDLAVGAPRDDDGGTDRGAAWIVFLNADGSAKGEAKISDLVGTFGGALADGDTFGHALAGVPALDADAIPDLVVGAPGDPDGGPFTGAVWELFLRADGTVKGFAKISQGSSAFGGGIAAGDLFGMAVASAGDIDGDGPHDLIAGAPGDDDGGDNRGAVYSIFVDDGQSAAYQLLGCSINPANSLRVLSGAPKLGTTMVLGVDNTSIFMPQPAGSLVFVALALVPDANYPCGTQVPGWGMLVTGLPGELLIDTSAGSLLLPLLTGPPWAGFGQPSAVNVPIPNQPGLIGTFVYAQGVIYDPTGFQGIFLGLADAVELRLGT